MDRPLGIEFDLGQFDGIDGGDGNGGFGSFIDDMKGIKVSDYFIHVQQSYNRLYRCLCWTSNRNSTVTLSTTASTLAYGNAPERQSWKQGGCRLRSDRSTGTASSRDKYGNYISRLEEKMAVLQEEAREYAQIVNINQNIEQELRRNKKEKPEVKRKMLEEYKAAMMAKKSKKIMERFQELEFERGMLEDNVKQKAELLFRRRSQKNQESLGQNPQRKSTSNKTEESGLVNSAFDKYRSQQKHLSNPDSSLPIIKTIKLPVISQSMRFGNEVPAMEGARLRPSNRSFLF